MRQASTRGSVSSASAAGAKGASFWQRLQALQPTLSVSTANIIAPPTTPSFMSYSLVVVPPPVPAATASFESHISTLLAHVPHPVFLTCTSYSPYFSDPAAEAHATHPASASEGAVSSTQQALAYLHAELPDDAGLVLTVTGTRTTTAASEGHKHTSHNIGGGGAASTLTGASQAGIRGVMHDVTRRTASSVGASGLERQRGVGLMVLRGDDGGYTRRCMAEGITTHADSSSTSPNPYAVFADGAALLRFIRSEQMAEGSDAVRDLCLMTGGYAQGHVLDRVWGTDTSQSDNDESEVSENQAHGTGASVSHQTRHSLQFLAHLEKAYADTEAQLRHAQGPHGAPRPASVETCRETADALLAQLSAVRQLWLTPSRYSAEARAACTRQLIEDKVLLRGSDAQGSCGGAHVIVTQMLASAQEFTAYVDDVQRALKDVVGDLASEPQEGAPLPWKACLILVPALMAPLRAEQFLRTTLQLKVIPSAPLQAALLTYSDALKSARSQLENASSSAAAAHRRDGRHDNTAVEIFHKAKEEAEVVFQRAMEDFTVALASELHALGYTHINFSAFQYGCGPAIGRVVARLPH
ncbi:hypothetical protein ABL78_3313 [Leptomonas seymouri]|uniref:Uncharacterized protein n=1 Tax=Leptomonas seymouri TaxID=5684 RepID=A0A0N1PDV8_LEPSE|nr:hypothetical protein ABL78_3313 [Leptomonas seymouri]|eukprot:KPI87604.1 hypothetical protein ABL78_3313 [Leptomonas seymouri]